MMAFNGCNFNPNILVKYENPRPQSVQNSFQAKYIKKNPRLGFALTQSPLLHTLIGAPFLFCSRNREDELLFRSRDLEILNILLPPREFEEDGQKWIQKISSVAPTRRDVILLKETLDRLLKESGAKEIGICPIRRELYSRCFDELLRQISIICTERGVVLYNIREELLMTLREYESLFQSGIAYGWRKALKAEEEREQKEKECFDLVNEERSICEEIRRLERELAELEGVHKRKEKELERFAEEEIEKQKEANKILKGQIESIIVQKRFAKTRYL